MTAIVLMVASAAIFFVIGAFHLQGTFFGYDLSPGNPALQKSMGEISPVVTEETTMWRCWVGFNAGFSMGAMLFGLIYGFLAIVHTSLLFGSPYLLVVGLLMVGGFCALSKAYLLSIPFVCTGISLACYVASIVVSLTYRFVQAEAASRLVLAQAIGGRRVVLLENKNSPPQSPP